MNNKVPKVSYFHNAIFLSLGAWNNPDIGRQGRNFLNLLNVDVFRKTVKK
jgi:hypothetical protein